MSQAHSSATYQISEDDFVGANRLFMRPSKKIWLICGSIAALLALLAILSPIALIRVAALGALIGGALGGLICWLFLAPWLMRRQYRSYPAIKEAVTIELEPNGVRFKTADIDALLAWKHMLKWRESNEYVLIYQNPRLYHVLPKSIAQSGFDFPGLVAALKGNVGAAT